MQIAHVTAPGRGETNRLLARAAQVLAGDGLRLAGTVQTDTETPRSPLCDMDVLVLPDGPTLRISTSLGPGASGCRLDPAGLEDSVALTLAGVERGPDLVIINKFGKQEAAGRGFRDAIGAAMVADIPVLVGVNEANRPALDDFCEGAAERLEPSLDAVLDWAWRVTKAARRTSAS
jgi:hypothetical protein